MLRTITALGLAAAVTGCGLAQSRLNPFTWFGGRDTIAVDERRPVTEAAPLILEDPRPLVDQVTSMAVERTAGGAIVRAEGLPLRQGTYQVDLVPEDGGAAVDGVLVLSFRAVPDPVAPGGTVRSRLVVGGAFLTDGELAGVRSIRVQAARNALVASR